MLGFVLGKEGLEKTFKRTFSDTFNIHRTRRNFPNNGISTLTEMAATSTAIAERVLLAEKTMKHVKDKWRIEGAVVNP